MRKNRDDPKPKMKRKEYEKHLRKLQTELCRLQDWIVRAGLRVIVIFEGRDAAGKGAPSKRSQSALARAFFASLPCPRPPIVKKRSSTCSVTCSICRPPAKW